jgi:hypothetical protein
MDAQGIQHVRHSVRALGHRESAWRRPAIAMSWAINHQHSVPILPGCSRHSIDAVVGEDGWPEHEQFTWTIDRA